MCTAANECEWKKKKKRSRRQWRCCCHHHHHHRHSIRTTRARESPQRWLFIWLNGNKFSSLQWKSSQRIIDLKLEFDSVLRSKIVYFTLRHLSWICFCVGSPSAGVESALWHDLWPKDMKNRLPLGARLRANDAIDDGWTARVAKYMYSIRTHEHFSLSLEMNATKWKSLINNN